MASRKVDSMALITFHDTCTQCGTCVAACPAGVFTQENGVGTPEVAQEASCIACGHCAAVCPVDAVVHSEFPEGTVLPIDMDAIPTQTQTLELLRSRRSVRVFSDKPVLREELERVLEAARVAPTAHNLQEVQYVVVQNRATLDVINKIVVRYFSTVAKQLRNPLLRRLYRLAMTKTELDGIIHMLPDFDIIAEKYAAGYDPILRHAPCLILAHSARTANFPETNAALALHNATLMAHSMGLGGFLTGYVVGACKRSRAIPDLLAIPHDHGVYAGLALGHPDIFYPKWIQRKPIQVAWK